MNSKLRIPLCWKGIQSVDARTHRVLFTAGLDRPHLRFTPSQRFRIENVPEALDAPGEWYLDAPTRTVRYIPVAGEKLEGFAAVAPVVRQLVVIRGEPAHPVEHLRIAGLTLENSDWQVDGRGVTDGQAAVTMNAAVETSWAQSVTIEDCRVAHVGQYGVWMKAGSRACALRRCDVTDLGGGGVKIGEGAEKSAAEVEGTSGNLVENCFIHDGGKIRPSAVGVWIGHSSYNTVTRCEICDFDYSGVSVGWDWDVGPSRAHHNAVTGNRIHHLGRGVLGDMGGVYTLGSSFGTEVAYNLIYAINGHDHAHGLYADEGSEGINFHHNIVAGCLSGGLHIHWGRGLTFENNLVAMNFGPAYLVNGHATKPTAATFERNIAVSNTGDFIGPDWAHWEGSPLIHIAMRSNAYWDPTGRPVSFGCRTFEEWQGTGQGVGHETGSVVGDPGVGDVTGLDFRMQPNAVSAAIGFETIDPGSIGLFGDAAWTGLPGRVQRGPDAWPAARPAIVQRFDGLPPGTRTPDAETLGESVRAGSSARVVLRPGGAGRCLRVQDAPGLPDPTGPIVVWFPELPPGAVRASFSVYLRRPLAATDRPIFSSVWQDTTNTKSHAGPRVFIDARGAVTVPGQRLMVVPFEQWVRISVDTLVGPGSTGAYTVRVEVPGQGVRAFQAKGEPLCRLEWYGFSAPGDVAVSYDLDDVEIRGL